MDIKALLNSGNLAQAIDSVTQQIKNDPTSRPCERPCSSSYV